jgi:hypothetical protein
MRAAQLILILSAALSVGRAHDVITTKLTWSREISRIVYKHCLSCHHEGGKTPMALLNYTEARPWAVAIKEEVLNRRMPPWPAMKGFGDFRDDISLTQEEISRIAEWVEGGAPEGDPNLLPKAPKAAEAAKPDLGKVQPLVLKDSMALPKGALLKGIRPAGSKVTVKVVAELPDGASEPLLWLRPSDPKWQRTFTYKTPVALPKGTRIVVSPPAEVTVFVSWER